LSAITLPTIQHLASTQRSSPTAKLAAAFDRQVSGNLLLNSRWRYRWQPP
jgi:hypothetical protein